MSQEELQVHGSMFVLLQKFIEIFHGKDAWIILKGMAGTSDRTYEMHTNYPVAEMFSIMNSATQFKNVTVNNLMEQFGEFLVPDLLIMYNSYINPTWKTFEMLEHTEQVMHTAVRSGGLRADPPVLHVTKVNEKLLCIDYYSRRRMASLGIGIIKGIAKFYGESNKVRIIPQTNPDDERVQLLIEFEP